MLREAADINKQIADRRAPDWEFFAGWVRDDPELSVVVMQLTIAQYNKKLAQWMLNGFTHVFHAFMSPMPPEPKQLAVVSMLSSYPDMLPPQKAPQ
jgi:hypothetical protein